MMLGERCGGVFPSWFLGYAFFISSPAYFITSVGFLPTAPTKQRRIKF